MTLKILIMDATINDDGLDLFDELDDLHRFSSLHHADSSQEVPESKSGDDLE